jgi:hypothetical protein
VNGTQLETKKGKAKMSKWEKGPVKLASGEEAFIDAINEGQEDYRYVGRIRGSSGGWIAAGWHANGRYMYAHTDHSCNLAPPPKKTVRVQAWITVLYNGESLCYYRQQAAKDATRYCAVFAIKKIEPFEVTEGDGL